MGQSLAIWKWRAGWPFRSDQRVRRLIAEDRTPFALARFDAQAFAVEIRAHFGDGEEPIFIIDVGDFKGHRANWIILSAGWSTPEQTLVELVRMCANRGLHIYAT